MHTQKNVLIEINPQCRLPRTFKRFCGLMVMLLSKLSIRASNGSQKLLKVPRPSPTTPLPRSACRHAAQQRQRWLLLQHPDANTSVEAKISAGLHCTSAKLPT